MCVQLPSRRQILAKLEAEKQALADLKKDPIALDPDAESLARLRALKGEAERPEKAQVPVRTAQVHLASLTCCFHPRGVAAGLVALSTTCLMCCCQRPRRFVRRCMVPSSFPSMDEYA